MKRRATTQANEKKKLVRTAGELAMNDKPEEAIRLIDEYLFRIDSPDIDLVLLKGHLLDMIGRFDEAAQIYKDVVRIAPENPQALMDLGDHCSSSRSGHLKALRYYERALRLVESGRFHFDPEDEFISACINKADTLLQLERSMDALRSVVYGLQKYPADVRLFRALERARNGHDILQEEGFSKEYHELKSSIHAMRKARL